MNMEIILNRENIQVINNQEYYFVCQSKKLTENTIIKIKFEDIDEEAFIIRKDGKLYCYSNECPHNHIRKLNEGLLTKHRITCPMHGWSFDLSTGVCINKSTAKLKKYYVIEANNNLYVKKQHYEKAKWMN